MGNLLSVLLECGGTAPDISVFVDFENALPNETNEVEQKLYNDAEDVLKNSERILSDIKSYKGASADIKEAITKSTPETEEKAWKTIVPLVIKLKHFYEFSSKLEIIVPDIMNLLCNFPRKKSQGEERRICAGRAEENNYFSAIAAHVEEYQSIVKQFAKLLEFVLIFDECKMETPALQNDFSYYRRTSQRMRNANRLSSVNPEGSAIQDIANDLPLEMANHMSFFYAEASPMLQKMSKAMSDFVKDNSAALGKTATDMLGMMATVCQKMLSDPELLKKKNVNNRTELFILRVMVGLIILYDHVHSEGAFAKGSFIDIKGCVQIIRQQDKDFSEKHMNILRYTTKHLNDENTPKAIKSLFAFTG